MAIVKKSLTEFLKRLRKEGPQGGFTWLIGAGMSASAGIPLAEGVSKRIILFEYLIDEDKDKPWDSQVRDNEDYDEDYNEDNLRRYFDWYDENENKPIIKTLLNEAIIWLQQQDASFRDVNMENSAVAYPLLFKHFFQTKSTQHAFLTNLVTRARGVNLAHFGLAGLLRDHPRWGHTVFTTNFDDLLLKALLGLNHTARVFGDLESTDKPILEPTYPQIVHLHGRHTGYRMSNTEEELKLIDPTIQKAFMAHIAESNLIVLGYSGWDDLAMQTLQDLQDNPNLMQGKSIFWIPFENKGNMRTEVQDFFNNSQFTVQIIEDEDNPLDADRFMLELCNTLNKSVGRTGFAEYRKDIIGFASNQHQFILDQLEHHPRFDPEGALKRINKAKEECKKGEFRLAEKYKKEAIQIDKEQEISEDLSPTLKAEIYLGIGTVEFYLGNFKPAYKYLSDAMLFWEDPISHGETDKNGNDSNKKAEPTELGRQYPVLHADTSRMMGELYFRQGDANAADDYLTHALYLYKQANDQYGVGYSYKLLADVAAREFKTGKMKDFYQFSIDAFTSIEDKYGLAISTRGSADQLLLKGKFNEAREHYETALRYYEEIDNKQGMATTLKSIGDAYLREQKYSEMEEYFVKARQLYLAGKNILGIANLESSLGDHQFQQKTYVTALTHYKKAAGYYSKHKYLHGYTNSLADMINCYVEIADDNNKALTNKIAIQLKKLCRECHNDYAWHVMIEHNFVNPKTEGKRPWIEPVPEPIPVPEFEHEMSDDDASDE